MPNEPNLYRFLGETAQGQIERGEVLASDPENAREQLRVRGLDIIELKPVRSGEGLLTNSRRLDRRMLADFTRSFADLVESAVPVADALQFMIEAETRRPLRLFVQRIERAVRSGIALSEAMSVDPAKPSRLLVTAVAAGERSGRLANALSHVADRFERGRQIRDMLLGQLTYPVILVGVIFLTLLFLSYFILPQFETIFVAAGAEPPTETRLVLAAGAFIRTYGVWLPALGVALVVCGQFVWRNYPMLAGRIQRAIPVLGPALTALDAAGYSRTLGVLLETGVPLVRAAEVAGETVSNIADQARLSASINAVRGGQPLSQALTRTGGMPDALVKQMRLGEETGELDRFLLRAAARYERDAETRLKRFAELLGPVLILLLGSFVGIVISAVLSGVLSLNDAIY